jgi:hypothetical protein
MSAFTPEQGKGLIAKTISLAYALIGGKDVSPERMEARVNICSTCEFVRLQGNVETGLFRCGFCKCKIKSDSTLINLARYEETSSYGCKHPEGSQWKKAGV